MRFAITILGLAVLSACTPAPPPSIDAEASVLVPLQGEYLAASETARSITGDLNIERGGLMFSRGAVLYTRVLNPRRGGDLVAREGDSFAAIALGPADLAIELRRVTEQVLGEGAPGLCGGDAPTYVAFAHDAHQTELTMLVFSGEEPPGPEATASRLCGAYVYAAPDGARTREGVLLR